MSAAHDGGPAYPGLIGVMTGIDSDGTERWETEPSGGMSLRNYFAAKAMQGFISAFPEWTHREIARAAYGQADAMLEASK